MRIGLQLVPQGALFLEEDCLSMMDDVDVETDDGPHLSTKRFS